MKVVVRDKELENILRGKGGKKSFPQGVEHRFRERVQFIVSARDERELYDVKAWRFEKLKGNRSHQHSLRLNAQFRLILEFSGEGLDRTAAIVSIEDYH
jgi:proteic killer suppression protein